MGTREETVHKALCSEKTLGKNGNPMFSGYSWGRTGGGWWVEGGRGRGGGGGAMTMAMNWKLTFKFNSFDTDDFGQLPASRTIVEEIAHRLDHRPRDC